MGLFPFFAWTRSSYWNGDSWLLTPALGDGSRWLALPLWIVATIGFIAAGLSLFGLGAPASMWLPLAVISSIASMVGVALFWNSFTSPGAAISAFVVDVLAIEWRRAVDVAGRAAKAARPTTSAPRRSLRSCW